MRAKENSDAATAHSGADLGLLCWRGEKNPSEPVAAGNCVGRITDRDFSAAGIVLAGMGCGCTSADCSAAGAACRRLAGGCHRKTRPRVTLAGIPARIFLRDFVVRRNLLLGLRHHASLWRLARPHGGICLAAVLHVHRALPRVLRISGRSGRGTRFDSAGSRIRSVSVGCG